jgi:hypothetical protein
LTIAMARFAYHHVETLPDWNVVVCVHSPHFGHARALLAGLGRVRQTGFYNVLVMQVDDGRQLLEVLRTHADADPGVRAALARVVPSMHSFGFRTPAEFERGGDEIVLTWAHALAGHSFHVRLHRRGLKGRLVSPAEERHIDQTILDESERLGRPARVDFDDPDFIVAVETVNRRAGVSLWTREDRQRFPLLGLD